MIESINEAQLETAVKMRQGITTLNLEALNKFVGDAILQIAEQDTSSRLRVKSAIEKVAKEQFTEEHGKASVSWVDYATEYSKNLDGNPFLLQELLADRLERS